MCQSNCQLIVLLILPFLSFLGILVSIHITYCNVVTTHLARGTLFSYFFLSFLYFTTGLSKKSFIGDISASDVDIHRVFKSVHFRRPEKLLVLKNYPCQPVDNTVYNTLDTTTTANQNIYDVPLFNAE